MKRRMLRVAVVYAWFTVSLGVMGLIAWAVLW
jgi:hypothetical protein